MDVVHPSSSTSRPSAIATASTSDSSIATHPERPSQGKSRQRLLRGLQRISSSPSLNGLRRPRSSSSPYRTRATLSYASLADVGASPTNSGGRSSTPQPSPLGLPSVSDAASPRSSHELPFFDSVETQLAVPRMDNFDDKNGAPATVAVYIKSRSVKQDVQNQAQISRNGISKPGFTLWEKLPYEIRVKIVSFLRPKELVQASRVSRSFHKLCFDGQCWTSLDASEFYKEIPAESLTRIIVAAGPFIKRLNLRGCVQVEHYQRTEAVVKSCRNLINATLEGCRNMQKSTLHTFLGTNEKLVHLNLTGLPAVSNTSCKIVSESCPQLESFNVSWCRKVEARGIKAVIDSCPKLRDLRAGEVRGFDDLSTAESIFTTNNLERLVLCGCVQLTDDALRVMMQGPEPEFNILTGRPRVPPRKLRHLDLSRCIYLSNSGVRTIGYAVPDLEGLQLSGCTLLTNAAVEPILASTPRLTHLELEDLEGLTNSLFSQHLAQAPCTGTLEHLSISHCEGISDLGMVPVLESCRKLKSIDMDNTRISDLSLGAAIAMILTRSKRSFNSDVRPKITLQLVVYDCRNVTWAGIREVLFRNAWIMHLQSAKPSYTTEIIGLKCFHGFQMTVDEHQKRVLRGDRFSADRLERKWTDYMRANEEVGIGGAGTRRRRRRAREAHTVHLNEEDGGLVGRRRARTMGSCSVM
ncbi:hypothetical protein E4U19_004398 [Claviceps sp. Clav32 group G5]|nr:hypothetical protein E4U19_004398 [Claviceps sp. Clav32 group G5]KAG6050305.1 hypothetical protein E4U39_004433 [Claviceps sp. Clav50 group G5]